jgi:hypothetical protein
MARLGNLIAAKYNKAEAVELFMKDLPHCDTAVFVDDNFDNVFNVFSRFAQLELKGVGNVVLHSVWYVPPADGMPEPCNARNVTLGACITRALPQIQEGRLKAHADCGAAGKLCLSQADSLARLKISWKGKGELQSIEHESVADFAFHATLFGALSVLDKLVQVTLTSGQCHTSTVRKKS